MLGLAATSILGANMTRNSWHYKACMILAGLLGLGAGLCAVAQEEDAPAAKPKARKTSESPIEVEGLKDARENPVILQLRQSDPKTLDQLTRALRITSQLDRADEFQEYAKRWLELTPPDIDLSALNRKYGADFFMELSRRKELQPEGEEIGLKVIEGASKFARDPGRLNDLIGKLSDKATQVAALRGLREAGDAGVVALIRALADDTFKGDRPAIRNGLAGLGRDSIEPLIATLSAPSADARADAAIVLGRLNARQSLQYLIGLAAQEGEAADVVAARDALGRFTAQVPDQQEASRFLAGRIRHLLAGEVVGKLNENDQIPLWRWDDEAQKARLDYYPKDQAALVVATRLAKQLSNLTDDPSLQQLALLVQLEAEQTFAGLDQPLPRGQGTASELAQRLGLEKLEAALVDGIKLDRPTAIAAALEVLGATGRSELLATHAGHESPLVIALGYPDRRVQVAALKAILALDPAETYPGASRVVETMKYLLSSSGQPRVLVGHPRFEEAGRIGALYGELGYEADTAATGRALVRQAQVSADYELILISETIDGSNVQETVQILRKDPRTARIPLGILEHFVVLDPKYFPDEIKDARDRSKNKSPTQEELLARLLADERHAPQRLPGSRAEKAANAVKLAVVVPAPQTPEGLRFAHDRVMELAPSRQVPPEIRLEQTFYVLEQLAELLGRKDRPAFYDLGQLEGAVIAASRVPALAAQAATVLGLLGTPKAQLALIEQASLPSHSAEDREAAAKAFAEAVRHRGLSLTVAQIQKQYDRHKSSAEDEKPPLRELLDIIESAAKSPKPSSPEKSSP
jgi:hypothetical protein